MSNTNIQLKRDLINLISMQKFVCVCVCIVSQIIISKQSIFINYVNPTKCFLFHCVDIPRSHSKTLQQPGMEIRMFVVEIAFSQSYDTILCSFPFHKQKKILRSLAVKMLKDLIPPRHE